MVLSTEAFRWYGYSCGVCDNYMEVEFCESRNKDKKVGICSKVCLDVLTKKQENANGNASSIHFRSNNGDGSGAYVPTNETS